ncbi:hypothetical protein BV22DRAFT_1020931, partial [Leucogyrophana mollusca]
RPVEPSIWDCFPHSVKQMVDWADLYVDTDVKDTSRNRVLIYKSPVDSVPDAVYPVSVNIQGVLKQVYLERLGTWDGLVPLFSKTFVLTFYSNPAKLHSASQRLVLGSAGGESTRATVLNACDDPHGWYACLSSDWDVLDAIPVAKIDKSGAMTALNYLLLSQGDFVEVGAEFDIVLTRDINGRNVAKVFLAFHHVIRLATVDELGIGSRVSSVGCFDIQSPDMTSLPFFCG